MIEAKTKDKIHKNILVKERVNMKKTKSRKLLLMIVVIIMVMSFTVTGLAYNYSATFTNYKQTNDSVRIINYVKDNNSFAHRFYPGISGTYSCYYSSRAYADGDHYSSKKMHSGNTYKHVHPEAPFTSEDNVRGKLRFYNSYYSGATLYIQGSMS